jgi:oligopeptidase B
MKKHTLSRVRTTPLVVSALLLAALLVTSAQVFATDDASSVPAPPVAKQVPKTTEIHGRTLVDNYAWMRD